MNLYRRFLSKLKQYITPSIISFHLSFVLFILQGTLILRLVLVCFSILFKCYVVYPNLNWKEKSDMVLQVVNMSNTYSGVF